MKKSIILMVLIPILLMGITNVYPQGKWEVTPGSGTNNEPIEMEVEVVNCELTINWMTYLMEDNNEKLHARYIINIYGEGEGQDTYNTYIIKGEGRSNLLQLYPEVPTTGTDHYMVNIWCVETGKTYIVTWLMHFTINANGTTVADFEIINN